MVTEFLKSMLGGGARQISGAVTDVAEVFRPNAEASAEREQALILAAQSQLTAEYAAPMGGRLDAVVNLMNRLPRPVLALGTVGLFVYAMVDPLGFTARMVGLSAVPDQLWWLLGAVVTFYFGARELHYARATRGPQLSEAVKAAQAIRAAQETLAAERETPAQSTASDASQNPALDEMLAR
ncbi:MAG: holin family protein [Pseudomonadota bacterium]